MVPLVPKPPEMRVSGSWLAHAPAARPPAPNVFATPPPSLPPPMAYAWGGALSTLASRPSSCPARQGSGLTDRMHTPTLPLVPHRHPSLVRCAVGARGIASPGSRRRLAPHKPASRRALRAEAHTHDTHLPALPLGATHQCTQVQRARFSPEPSPPTHMRPGSLLAPFKPHSQPRAAAAALYTARKHRVRKHTRRPQPPHTPLPSRRHSR